MFSARTVFSPCKLSSALANLRISIGVGIESEVFFFLLSFHDLCERVKCLQGFYDSTDALTCPLTDRVAAQVHGKNRTRALHRMCESDHVIMAERAAGQIKVLQIAIEDHEAR